MITIAITHCELYYIIIINFSSWTLEGESKTTLELNGVGQLLNLKSEKKTHTRAGPNLQLWVI